MTTDKPSKIAVEQLPWSAAPDWVDSNGDDDPPASQQQLRIIIGRAAMVYLGLLFGLGAVMSLLGINPLVNNGLMPKALLIFVGSALLLALANTLLNFLRDYGRSWLGLMGRWGRSGKK